MAIFPDAAIGVSWTSRVLTPSFPIINKFDAGVGEPYIKSLNIPLVGFPVGFALGVGVFIIGFENSPSATTIRVGTGAVQKLAHLPTHWDLAKRRGVRLSSAALSSNTAEGEQKHDCRVEECGNCIRKRQRTGALQNFAAIGSVHGSSSVHEFFAALAARLGCARFGSDEIGFLNRAGELGEHLLGLNVIGSYVVLRQKKDPDLGLVYPSDYVLVMSRVAFIPKNAKRPNAAKLFMDYLLSARAQTIMANQAMLFALRDDVEGPYSAAALSKELGSRIKPIPVDMSLLAALAPAKRLAMMRRWQETARAQ